MMYTDLLNVKYTPHGRSKEEGFDCYGLVIECCRRNGTPLYDIKYEEPRIKVGDKNLYMVGLNVEEVQQYRMGDIVQCNDKGALHIGFILDDDMVIHTTTYGVRISPMFCFKDRKYYRVINNKVV